MFSLFTAVLVPCQATVECLFPWTVDCRITGSDMCMHIICLNTKLSFIMQKSTSQTTPKHRTFSSHSVFPSALLSLGPLTYSPGSLLFSSDGANVSFGEGQPASVPAGSYPAPGFSNMRLVFSFMSLIRMTCLSKEREAHSNSRPWQDFVKTCW